MSKECCPAVPVALISWLTAQGFDGLTDGDECGCTLADLGPCGGCMCHCFPAYNHGKKHGALNWMSTRKMRRKKT